MTSRTEIIVFIYNRLKVFFHCNFSYINIIFKTFEFLILYICCGTETGKWRSLHKNMMIARIICFKQKVDIRNIQRAFKIVINRDLFDKMLCLFHCLLFPFRASKKMEIRAGGGFLKLGNPGGRGVVAVWEIQSEGGQKCLPSVGWCLFFLE